MRIVHWTVPSALAALILAAGLPTSQSQTRLAVLSHQNPGTSVGNGWADQFPSAAGILIRVRNRGGDTTNHSNIDAVIQNDPIQAPYVLGYTSSYCTRSPSGIHRRIDALYQNYRVDRMQVGSAPPGTTQSLSPMSTGVGPSPASALFADSLLPAASLSPDGCVQPNGTPIELNRTAASASATASSDLPDTPGPQSTGGTRDLSRTRAVPPALAMKRNTKTGSRTLDGKFILLHSLSTVALFADLETTAHALAGQPKATELNGLFGGHPTRARLYGIALPLDAVSFYLSYRSKKTEPRRNVWKIAPGLSIAVHTAAAINNLIVAHR